MGCDWHAITHSYVAALSSSTPQIKTKTVTSVNASTSAFNWYATILWCLPAWHLNNQLIVPMFVKQYNHVRVHVHVYKNCDVTCTCSVIHHDLSSTRLGPASNTMIKRLQASNKRKECQRVQCNMSETIAIKAATINGHKLSLIVTWRPRPTPHECKR